MKKTITAMILLIALAFCLTACGSGDVATLPDNTAAAERPEIPIAKGEATVDVGDFTVTVPEGWLGAGDIDFDDNGNYIIATYYYLLIKGGESADEQFSKPTLSIYYSSDTGARELLESNMNSVDENMEFDVTVGGKKCPAYHAVMDYSEEGEDPFVMEYDNVFIPVTDSSCLRLTMLTYVTSEGETGISASDEDVIAIMESLKVN